MFPKLKKSQTSCSDMSSEAGLSLLEVAIVVVIIGIMTVPLFELYRIMTATQTQDATREHLKNMVGMINSYRDATKTYPCPSDRAAAPGTPTYRKQFNDGKCSLSQLAAMPAPLVYVPSMSPQAPVCTANFGFCIVQGTQDKDGDGALDPILIGGIPIEGNSTQTMRDAVANYGDPTFPSSQVLDGWDDNFTYAVSQKFVFSSATPNSYGVIDVVDENNLPTNGINGNAHFVVVSHGPDRKGAYGNNGSVITPCGTVAAALDNDNCDNDKTFRSALGMFGANDNHHFDDIIMAYSRSDSGIWTPVLDSAFSNTGSIRNLNKQNVGIGTETPVAKLDINGDVKADYNVLAAKICKNDGSGNLNTDCFDINSIAGTGMKCPKSTDPSSATIMQGISNGQPICVTPKNTVTTPKKNFSCPQAGQFIYGINVITGDPLCTF